jgi:hypothetical protein
MSGLHKSSNQKSRNNKCPNKNLKENNTTNHSLKKPRKICAAICNPDEPQFRCLMKTKGNEKYCSMHILQKNVMDYNYVDDDIFDLDQKNLEPDKIITNELITKISVNNLKVSPIEKKNEIISPLVKSTIMHEQKVSTVKKSFEENEDDLEIKLLILVNDEYSELISVLIGPVFDDITLSEDEQDPVTYDEFWTIKNDVRVPGAISKYYLFSYIDSQNKIRCLTVFTMYSMINEKNYVHPITMEEIPHKDVKRAKKLINLYQSKLGLFKIDESNLSAEFKLKNRLVKLFKQFHVHSIFFEENWLLQINDKSKLYRIIRETEKLISNNIKSINPNLHNFKIFQKKDLSKLQKNNKLTAQKIDGQDEICQLHEYIVEEWEKLVAAADTPLNQLPAWILASGLSFVVPEVKQKFPNLEI